MALRQCKHPLALRDDVREALVTWVREYRHGGSELEVAV